MKRFARSAAAMLVVCGSAMGITFVAGTAARATVTTVSNDTLRTGWYPNAGTLTKSLVTGGNFGQQFSAPVSGQVYAQPLVANNTLLVVTETNNVYGLNPVTGAQRWTRNVGVPWNPTDVNCSDLTPSIGITGTPVVDSASNTMYFLNKTYVSGTTGAGAWYAHAVDITTGAEKPNFPVLIRGTASNDATQSFNPTTQMQRPGLLLMGGVIYAGFGAHCDVQPYSGWVVGISTAGSITTLWSSGDKTGAGSGIWQSGSGLVSDGAGQILLATGNGDVASVPTAGKTPPSALGQAVVRLAVQSDGSLKATDFFAPYDAATLNTWDADLGSGGPVGLPAGFGTTAHPHLMLEVGKQGYVYMLDRDNIGGMGQGPSGGDAVLGRFGPDGGVWGKPAAWPGDGGYVYITTASAGTSAGAGSGTLNAYQYGVNGSGLPALTLVGKASSAFGLSSSPAVITSNGTTAGSSLVWVVYAPSGTGSGAQLRVYDPHPVGGLLTLLASWPIGISSKFAAPMVDGGNVYVGTRDGHVLCFGSPTSVPMTGTDVSWKGVVVGSSSTKTSVFTANANSVTVNSVASSNSDFTPKATTPALPVTLSKGQKLSVPVQFKPHTTGLTSGVLTLSTSLGPVTANESGAGLSAQAQLSITPATISFGGAAVGSTTSTGITLTNIGAQSLTISSVTKPSAPFSVTGAPAAGYVLASNTSVNATASFSPTVTGSFTGTLAVATTANTATVSMSGSGGQPANLSVSPLSLNLGSVAVGSSAAANFTVANTGGSTLTITKSKPPGAGTGFTAVTTLAEGTTLAPGTSLTETVKFTPSASGSASDSWIISGDDSSGAQTVALTGSGVGSGGTVPSPNAGGWTLNANSVLTSTTLQLTDATTQKGVGTAFWPTAVPSGSLDVSFDAAIDSGTGADGLTFAFADPSHGDKATSVGLNGGGLGWSHLHGIAFALDTHQNGTDPSSNFVGIATGYDATNNYNLVWQATSTAIPPLRGTVRHIHLVVSGGTLTASVDGTQVINATVTLPASTLVGFTGSDGGLTDRHAVSNVVIKY